MKNNKLLTEICDGCTHYCTLKEILLHDGLEDRTAMQIKMIEKFKYVWSQETGSDVGWEEATKKYVDSGLAKEYANQWSPDSHVLSLYSGLKKWYDGKEA